MISIGLGLPAWSGLSAQSEPERARVEDEILVTSNKREMDLDEVPEAVSLVSGEDLANLNVTRLDDINGLLPGITVAKNDGAGRVVAIRGVGWETAQNLATQPGVLLYVDGVYIVNPLAFGLDLQSIERVEVFRGPQGTEFGQSAVGGAVHLVTEPPSLDRRSVDASLAVGSYDRMEASAALNLPLGDRLAFRLSGRSLDRDGFAEIRGGELDGYDLDDADNAAARLVALWTPTSSWSLKVSGAAYDSNQHGAAQKHVKDPLDDPRLLTQDFPSQFGLDSDRASMLVHWTGGSVLLQSLTALQELSKRQTLDGDRLTEDLLAVDLTGFGPANFDLLPVWDNASEAVSQEFAALGGNGRFEWVTGLYYLKHENHNFFVELIGPAPAAQFAEKIANPTPENLPPLVPPLEFVEDRTVTRWDTAAYGQTSISLFPGIELTLGGRWQRDRSRDRTTQFWFIDSEQEVEDSEATWRLGVNVGLGDDYLFFGSVATGWKNGGLNPGALTGGALDVPATFEPEEVTTVEVGTRNGFSGRRGHLSAIGFYSDYRNYQYIQEDPVPFSAGTGNIPEVTIRGLELEAGWQFSRSLDLLGQFTALDGSIESPLLTLDVVDFLNSEIGRFTPGAVDARAALRENVQGNLPPKLPDLSAHLALTHRHRTARGSLWTSRVDLVHRGEYQYRVFNHPEIDTVPDYTTVSLFAGYQPAGAHWNASLSISNLLDHDGVNSRFTNPFGLHTTSEEFIPPRQVVARIALRF